MPDYGNPQALNRYAYALNNPVRYNDPSGHCVLIEEEADGLCVHISNEGNQSTVQVVHGGDTFDNEVEVALANYLLSGDDKWLNAIPEDTLPDFFNLSLVAVEEMLGYKTIYDNLEIDPTTILFALTIIPGDFDDDDDAYLNRESSGKGGGGRPGSNFAQNRQYRGAVRELERQLGRRLTKPEIQRLHYELHQLEDPGFWDIVEQGLRMFK